MEKTPRMTEVEKRIGEPIEDFLRREYAQNKRSLHTIAHELGIGSQTVLEWMKIFNINTRNVSEAQTIIQSKKNRPSKEELYKLYVVDGLTASEIGKKLGVHMSTVARWIRKTGLKDRRPSKEKKQRTKKVLPTKNDLVLLYQTNGLPIDEIGERFNIKPIKVIGLLEEFSIPLRQDYEGYYTKIRKRKFKKPTHEQLRKWYLEEKRSSLYIAKLVGATKYTILTWLKKAGVKTRKSDYDAHGYTFKKPTKAQLQKWYCEELKGTVEIARMVDVDPASIRNWMIEYGISRRSQVQSKFALKGRLVEEPTQDELDRLYNIEKKTTVEIAKIYSVSDITVGRWLEKAGIKRRGFREATYLALGKEPVRKPTKEELERWYSKEKKSTHIIAKELGVTQITVWRWLNDYGTLKRSLEESQYAFHGKEVEKPSADELKRLYVQEGKSIIEIGDLFGISPSTVAEWLERIGIERREVLFGYKESLRCSDGDRVRSTYERRVDNWLYENGIPHAYDQQLPGANYRCDFKVGDTYIEIWGIVGYGPYEDRMEQEKVPYYEENRLARIDLFPEDFDSKHSFTRKLGPLLKYSDLNLRKQRQIKEH